MMLIFCQNKFYFELSDMQRKMQDDINIKVIGKSKDEMSGTY